MNTATATAPAVDLSPFAGDTPLAAAVRRFLAAKTAPEPKTRRLTDAQGRFMGVQILDQRGTVCGNIIRERDGRLVEHIVDFDGNWVCRQVVGRGSPRPDLPTNRPRGSGFRVGDRPLRSW